jgi:hypothetical protein
MPKLTDRQTAAILAALRLAQLAGHYEAFKIMPQFEGVGKPLRKSEIDYLCEKINCKDVNNIKSSRSHRLLTEILDSVKAEGCVFSADVSLEAVNKALIALGRKPVGNPLTPFKRK